MLKRLGYVAAALVIFVMGGLAGGYFMAGDRQLAAGEACAGGCVNVVRQGPTTQTNSSSYPCAYNIRFDKTPALTTHNGNNVNIYFR